MICLYTSLAPNCYVQFLFQSRQWQFLLLENFTFGIKTYLSLNLHCSITLGVLWFGWVFLLSQSVSVRDQPFARQQIYWKLLCLTVALDYHNYCWLSVFLMWLIAMICVGGKEWGNKIFWELLRNYLTRYVSLASSICENSTM